MNNKIFFFCCFMCIISCIHTKQKELIISILDEWNGKTVIFPDSLNWFGQRIDSVDYVSSEYKILNYVDSLGCLSCDLRLREWNILLKEFHDRNLSLIPVFIFSSKNKKIIKEVCSVMKQSAISFPIIVDSLDRINKLNHFPGDTRFQTFLLDKNNKVLIIGNPMHNPKVKELYLNIIQGKTSTKEENTIFTKIRVKENMISLGRFNWQEERKAQFMIYNVGKRPLVINDVTTSCGCTSVDYFKQPVSPSDSVLLQVTYKADHPEHFDKTITVYCNTNPSLIQLKITGDAE